MASSSSMPDIAGIIDDWSRPSQSPTSNIKALSQAVEICKHSLMQHAEAFVRSLGDLPVLVSYSSDGTPLQSRKSVQGKLPSRKVRRTGRGSDEFLVQNCFFRALDATGQARTAVVLLDPLPRSHGKSALAMFSCYRRFAPNVRSWGHRGVQVVHFASDRAAFTALRDLIFQHNLSSTLRFVDDNLQNQNVLDLHQWPIATPCALHDAHNSLKWSLLQYFNDNTLTTDVHIGIDALRNSTDLIHGHLGAWLLQVVTFVPHMALPSEDQLHALWLALGVAVDTLDFLSSTLRLHWDGSNLCLDERCRDRGALLEELSGVILELWSFQRFSTSRWVTVGCACRSLMCAWLSGLDHFVKHVSALPGVSLYYLGGYQRLQNRARDFVIQCGMISYLPESILTCLLEDSRVARHIDSLKEEVHTELSWLSGMVPFVWERLATCAEEHGFGSLRTAVLHGAFAAAGFLDQKVFRHAAELPWTLASGNIEENIMQLLSDACPEEPIASKVWTLGTHGFNHTMLAQGLRLLLEVPWGTVAAEQQHASATLMKKHHKELTTETLRLRAFAHSMKHLFPETSSAQEHKLRKTMKRLDKLASKRPQSIGGRQVLLKDLISIAKFRQQHGRSYGPEVQKQLMRHHVGIWGKLPTFQRDKFEQRALAMRSSKEQTLAEEMDALRTDLSLQQERLKKENDLRGQGPVLLSACKLPLEVIGSWNTMAASTQFNPKSVASLRQACSTAPPLPTSAEQALLRQHAGPSRIRPDKPRWLATVCKHREMFLHHVFEYEVDGVLTCGFVLYIMQSPLDIVLLMVRKLEAPMSSPVAAAQDWEEMCLDAFDNRWTMNEVGTLNWESLSMLEASAIKVYPDVSQAPDGDFVSDGDAQTLAVMFHMHDLQMLERAPTAQKPDIAKKAKPAHDHLVQEHPWLSGFLEPETSRASGSVPSIHGNDLASGADLDVTEAVELDDDVVNQVYEELEAKRLQWRDDGFVEQQWFRVTLLGGAWLRQKRGRTYDAFKGAASGGAVSDWCSSRGLQKSMRFEVTLYGERGAAIMARAFCHKMSHFYELCRDLDELDHVFSMEEKQAYAEPPELTDFATSLTGQALRRVLQLRDLWP